MVTPVLLPLAVATDTAPAMLAAAAAIVASFAFTLPVSCANNAIAYATGKVPVGYMMARGFVMLLLGLIVATLFGWLVVPAFLGG